MYVQIYIYMLSNKKNIIRKVNHMIFRKSNAQDIDKMMDIVNDAKSLLKSQNINQWQSGYPNRLLLEQDIRDGIGYVLCDGGDIVGMCAITFGADESYYKIDGHWKTNNSNYAVVHRMAVASNKHNQGLGVKIYQEAEKLAIKQNVQSIRADTHQDNIAMQKTMKKSGFEPCGIIYIKGGEENGHPRLAMEKIIVKK